MGSDLICLISLSLRGETVLTNSFGLFAGIGFIFGSLDLSEILITLGLVFPKQITTVKLITYPNKIYVAKHLS